MSDIVIDAGLEHVTASAPFRPVFEPRAGSRELDLRARLRLALRGMRAARDGEILRCVYSGPPGFVDAENVLLYNIGLGTFDALTAHGVAFERRHGKPAHLLDYRFSPTTPSIPRTIVATWSDVPWPGSSSTPKVGALWHALRAAGITVHGTIADAAPFGVRVVLTGDAFAPRPVHAMKPVLDAIVSALHSTDAPFTDAVVGHVADQCGHDVDTVRRLLHDSRGALLEARAYVHLYRTSVKWNPADERCVIGEVVYEPREGPVAFSGEVFAA